MEVISIRLEDEIIEELQKTVTELKTRGLIKSSTTRSSVLRELIVDWIKVKEKILSEVTEVEKLVEEGLKNNE